MGGAMELLEKITKKCLKAALKDCIVTEETLHTYLVEIASIANSCLLTPVTNDPNDIESLTRNHFLVGRALPNQRSIATTKKDTNLFEKQHKL